MKFLEDLISESNSPQLIPRFKQVERKLLSVFMALLQVSPHIRGAFLNHCGYPSGRTCTYQSHMEVGYKGSKYKDVRPDGLIVCSRGKSVWSAFLEAKAEQKEIRSDQIQDYVDLAALVGVSDVVTISNEFARQPSELPYRLANNKRKGVNVHHFAWADIRTLLELERANPDLLDIERALLEQCLDYLWYEASGVLTYDAMPKDWPNFVEAASTTLGFNQNIKGFADIVYGWQ